MIYFRGNSWNIFFILFLLIALGFYGDAITAQEAGDIPLPNPKIFFKIKVIDQDTGRGIPLVQLTTITGVDYYTDNAGNVAFYEPELMNKEVYFIFDSPGYTMDKDGFMNEYARSLKVTPGGAAELIMKRENIAQRLYRYTGTGIYHDTVLLGETPPVKQPLMNANVCGQDSAHITPYKGKLFWLWGDTTHPRHPLAANFKTSCGTSLLPSQGGLDPEIGVDITYFQKGDFVKPMVPIPDPGMYWLGSLLTVKDKEGRECLLAHCSRIKPPMETVGRSLVRFNDEKEEFEQVCQYPLDDIIDPNGHPFLVSEQGEPYFYFFGDGVCRTRPEYEAVVDHEKYESFTCLKQGMRFNGTKEQLDRRGDGSLTYSWKRGASALGHNKQRELGLKGFLKPEEFWFGLADMATGKEIGFHGGAISWNEYRKRWVMILNEIFGTSVLGEIWYAEGDTPLGPWMYAQKIVTHKKYSFYNVVQHPYFAGKDGKIIFFEGTYTRMFSGNDVSTPRYEYNQIMYKLDLEDERIILPVPVYRMENSAFRYLTADKISDPHKALEIAFFALDRQIKGTVPVYECLDGKRESTYLSLTKPEQGREENYRIAFYGLGRDSDQMTSATLPLYEWTSGKTQNRIYSLENEIVEKEYEKAAQALCRVWKYPRRFNPLSLYDANRGRLTK